MIEANAIVESAETVEEPFDFDQHRLKAVEDYRKIRGIYERFAEVVRHAIRRRFIALAGMLEIADREFQTIQDEDERIRTQARVNVKAGKLEEVEITPDAPKSYLDERFGPDGRMSQFSYDFLARQLRHIGFTNFRQIDECIAGYDDNRVSRAVWSIRQGQITRFEFMLLAGMGPNYSRLHPWVSERWFQEANIRTLKKLEDAGIPIRNYTPVTKAAESTTSETTAASTVAGNRP